MSIDTTRFPGVHIPCGSDVGLPPPAIPSQFGMGKYIPVPEKFSPFLRPGLANQNLWSSTICRYCCFGIQCLPLERFEIPLQHGSPTCCPQAPRLLCLASPHCVRTPKVSAGSKRPGTPALEGERTRPKRSRPLKDTFGRWPQNTSPSPSAENETDRPVCETYPAMFPPGPMEVLNIRLKETGGLRSFPVMGDFTL